VSDGSHETFRETFLDELRARDQEDLYLRLEGSPGDLLDLVTSDDGFREDLSRADALSFLKTLFEPQRGEESWQATAERSGRLGEAAAGTEWSFEGLHVHDDVFNGIRATGRPVVVRGFTIMSLEEERFKVRRYVDWAGLYGQLGLTVNWRVPLENPLPPEW
jgi:hypothetical protein